MDVDIVTQPLVELDLNIVLERVCASGVRIVESVTSSLKSSSVLHLPCRLLPIDICRYIACEAKFTSQTVKSLPNAVNQISKDRAGTLRLENSVRLQWRGTPIYPGAFFGPIPASEH